MVGPNYIKRINQARILNLLRLEGRKSRAEIARRLGLTRSTVSLLTADLITRGVLIDTEQATSAGTPGRPSTGIQLNPDGGYFIGVEIGVEIIRVIALNLMVETLAAEAQPLVTRDPAAVIERVALMIGDIRARVSGHIRLNGVGITIPGMLSRRRLVEYALVLGWHNVEVGSVLSRRLGLPVFVENDANAAALAEFYFGGVDVDENLFYLLLDVGVGGGMIIDGKIYTGSYGTAGEIGHLRMPVTLGRDGDMKTRSFEDCVGKRALLGLYREHGGTSDDFAEFCRRLDGGEETALKTIRAWGYLLSLGILNVIDIVNPSHIILGGPLARFFPYARESLDLLQKTDPFPGALSVRLTPSSFKEDACVMGGAATVYDSLFRVTRPG